MKKDKESADKLGKQKRPTENKKEKDLPRPVKPVSPNLGFHGKDREKDLNPEE